MPDKPLSKREKRRHAKERRLAERRSIGRRRWIARVVVITAVAAVIAAVVTYALSRTPPESPAVAVVQSERYPVEDEGRTHVQPGSPIAYRHYPPSSGPHYPALARYGVHSGPVPEGAWVHSLEHGAIVLLYRCTDDCRAKSDEIRGVFGRLPDGAFGEVKLVATPNDRGPTDYTLLAWGWQEDLESFDAARVERFYRDRVDKGPERAP